MDEKEFLQEFIDFLKGVECLEFCYESNDPESDQQFIRTCKTDRELISSFLFSIRPKEKAKSIPAFRYDPTPQLRHKRDPRNWHGQLKPHHITPDKARARAQSLVKKLGLTHGTMLDGKIVAWCGTQRFTLEPYYFGVPADTPNAADISFLFSRQPKEKAK